MAHYVQLVEKCRGRVSDAELAQLIANNPDPLSPALRDAAEVKADDLYRGYAGAEPFSFQRQMDDITVALGKPGVGGLKPADPKFWEAVFLVLYERQWRAFDTAADRGQVECPWDALDAMDFAYDVEHALTLAEDDPVRVSVEIEVGRRDAAARAWRADYEARQSAVGGASGPANDEGDRARLRVV